MVNNSGKAIIKKKSKRKMHIKPIQLARNIRARVIGEETLEVSLNMGDIESQFNGQP